MAKRKTLSELTKPGDLESVFGCNYETHLRISMKMPLLSGLRPVLLGKMDKGTWGEVCCRYTAFFTKGTAGIQRRERIEVKGAIRVDFRFPVFYRDGTSTHHVYSAYWNVQQLATAAQRNRNHSLNFVDPVTGVHTQNMERESSLCMNC